MIDDPISIVLGDDAAAGASVTIEAHNAESGHPKGVAATAVGWVCMKARIDPVVALPRCNLEDAIRTT